MQTRIYLTPADHGRALSWEEFETAHSQEGYRYEMIEGRLYVSPVPEMPHDDLKEWLEAAFRAYARDRPDILCRITGAARVFLAERLEGVTAPEPDIACYSEYPNDRPLKGRSWRAVSPLFVVEILSEDNQDKDLERNCRLYLEVASIREYWILDPLEDADRPSLIVYRRRGRRWAARRLVPPGGTYTTPMLPGFSLFVDPWATPQEGADA
jgi:Uma2 family endonuclease